MSKHYSFPELEQISNKMGSFLKRNSHGVIGDLREVMRPKQVAPGNWYRISCTGELGLCDYGAGIVCVHFYCFTDYLAKDKFQYLPRIYINTLDDGEWEAAGKTTDSKEECENFVDKHAGILDNLTKLPTTEEFNEILRPLGMFGGFF